MKKIVAMVLTGSIACVFAVAPAFAANNDPGIDQREVNQQTESTKGYRVVN